MPQYDEIYYEYCQYYDSDGSESDLEEYDFDGEIQLLIDLFEHLSLTSKRGREEDTEMCSTQKRKREDTQVINRLLKW